MDSPKLHRHGTPLGSLFPAGMQSHREWLRSLPTYQANGRPFPQLHQKHLTLCGTCQNHEVTKKGKTYDVKALFTFVPVDPAISIIKSKLQQNPQLHSRTSMSVQYIITLVEFCLKSTCFPYRLSIMNGPMVQSWVPPSALK